MTVSSALGLLAKPRSIEGNERAVTDDDVPPSRALLWLILAFTTLALAWAAFARVETVVRAPGRLMPGRGLQRLAHMDGGTVAAVLVHPGDIVIAGQPLVRLTTVDTDAARDRDRAQRDVLQMRIARLGAEATDGMFASDPSLPLSAARSERTLFTAHASEQRSARTTAEAHAREAARALDVARVQSAARAAASAFAAREVATLTPLVAKGIEPAQSLARAQAAFAEAAATATAARAEVGRADAALAAARAEADDVGHRFRAAAADALATARADLAVADAAAPAYADRADRQILRAPLAGTVKRVLVAGAGSVARPGEPLVEIVPAGDAPSFEAHVAARDIAAVHLGQRATLRLAAYDAALYAPVEGRVTLVAPDAEQEEGTRTVFYTVRIAPAPAPGGLRGGSMRLLVGMTGEAELRGPSRTILSYLLTPFTPLHDTALTER